MTSCDTCCSGLCFLYISILPKKVPMLMVMCCFSRDEPRCAHCYYMYDARRHAHRDSTPPPASVFCNNQAQNTRKLFTMDQIEKPSRSDSLIQYARSLHVITICLQDTPTPQSKSNPSPRNPKSQTLDHPQPRKPT